MYSVSIDATKVLIALRSLNERSRDVRPALRSFHAYMAGRTSATFFRLGHRGGTYRGVTWANWANQYTRKTDGVVVPAWGGVEKIRKAGVSKGRYKKSGRRVGKRKLGLVKGRLRGTGRKRVTEQSKLLQNTGRLKTEATTNVQFRNTSMMMKVAKGYAPKQQAMRPFLFFEKNVDAAVGRKYVTKYIMQSGAVSNVRKGSALEALQRRF